MCATVICSVVLCLLGAGSLDAEVTQTPGHLIKGEGQNVKMSCVPQKGHRYVYWYQQILAKEFKFLVSFQDKNVFETEMPKNRFLAEYPQNSPCTLEIQGTERQDSATYLCASSEPTLLNISSARCTNSPWARLRKQVARQVKRKRKLARGGFHQSGICCKAKCI